MKKILLAIAALLLGTGLGGGAAFGTSKLLGGKPLHKPAEPEPVFVPTSTILAPLVAEDGKLSGYAQFEVQLQVAATRVDQVTQRMPLLLNAINMRTYRSPMAVGPDGMVPDLELFRSIVMDAANEALGKGVVRRVAVTQAQPA
ncbi:hypothetical protein [Sphingomonas quercus]|uniref:Flagellar basal body-associated FliL family protein n=1 Tax=Sphingomonas quercus TaxID=2842451 RepID=A0ABS6BN17_9SPHN|nr:hypothetical protein [Sphingomonas quercus]MBU3078639.1 hypothetical protein [Sphingomonas quercus]